MRKIWLREGFRAAPNSFRNPIQYRYQPTLGAFLKMFPRGPDSQITHFAVRRHAHLV